MRKSRALGKGNHEDDHIRAFFQWVRLFESTYPEFHLIHLVPQGRLFGGKRGALRAMRLAKLGVRPGIPDVHWPHPGAHGESALWIEFKSAVGVVSPEQHIIHDMLRQRHHSVTVARSWREAAHFVCEYSGLSVVGLALD